MPKSTYYQNQIANNPNHEEVFRDFFSKLSDHKIPEIADFLKAVEKKCRPFSEKKLQKLSERINALARVGSTKPEAQEVVQILNSLTLMQYKKSDLPLLNGKNLTKIFQSAEKLSAHDIVSFLHISGKLGYDKDELEINHVKLNNAINSQYGVLLLGQKIDMLNSLAQLGFYENSELALNLSRMVSDVQNKIGRLDGKSTAAYIHACAKLEMFDHLSNNREVIIAALTPKKIAAFSSETAFSLLQAQMFCDLTSPHGKFFSDAEIAPIAKIYVPRNEKISGLQKLVGDVLESMKYEVKAEYPLYQIAGKEVRSVDLHCSKKVDDSLREYHVEIDGPSHFIGSSTTQNSATKKRDRINLAAIARRKDSIGYFYYFDLSYSEIEANYDHINDFLERKIKEAKPLNNLAVAEAVEEVLAVEEIKIQITEPVKSDDNKKSKNSSKSKKPATSVATTKVAAVNYSTKLEMAIAEEKVDEVERMVRDGVDIQAANNGLTPLAFAIKKFKESEYSPDPNYLSIINSLVCAGADTKEVTAENLKILFDASLVLEQRIESLASAIIRHDSFSPTNSQITAAINSNSLQLVEALIEKGIFSDPNSEISRQAIKDAAKFVGDNKKEGDIQILNSLIDKAGISSAHMEIEGEEMQVVLTKFIKHCPEIFTRIVEQNNLSRDFLSSCFLYLGEQEVTLLHSAAQYGREDLVKFLTDESTPYGNNINRFGGFFNTVLMEAVGGGHLSVVKILVEDKGANLQQNSGTGFFALHKAVTLGNLEMVEYLVEHGADINQNLDRNLLDQSVVYRDKAQKEALGLSTIFAALSLENREIAKLLIKKRGNLGFTCESDNDLFMDGIYIYNFELVKRFLEGGIDPNKPRQYRNELVTPLEMVKKFPPEATEAKNIMLKILLDGGMKMKPSATVSEANTPSNQNPVQAPSI